MEKIYQDNAVIVIVTHGQELWGAERLRRILSNAGLRVVGVNADEMQSTFLKKKPTLVIANLAGERSADLEFCQKISRLCQVPIIAIGSAADEDTIVSMIEAVVDDYLVRPIHPPELVARVQSILRRMPPGARKEDHIFTHQETQAQIRSKRGFQRIFRNMQRWMSKYRGIS